MNITGNIMAMYNTFQDLVAAYSTCDYGKMLERIGNLVKRLYNVAPIEAASAIPKLDLRKTEFY
jgi:hypothetical protein